MLSDNTFIKLSVVYPCYNVEKYIEASVNSVANQALKHNDIEIILVDDGSTDDTLTKANLLAEKYDFIKVLSQKNSGSGIARNTCMKVASGEYICFLDPDDIVEDGYLNEFKKVSASFPFDIMVLGFHRDYLDENERVVNSHKYLATSESNGNYINGENYAEYLLHHLDAPMTVWDKIYRLDFLKENSILFDAHYLGQDAVFNMHVLRTDIQHVYLDNNCYYHYIYRAGSAVNKFHKFRLTDNFYIAKEYFTTGNAWLRNYDVNSKDVEKFIAFAYIRDLNIGIKNVCLSELTEKEKVEWVKNSIDADMHRRLKTVDLNDYPKTEQIKIRLLRLRLYRLVVKLNERKLKRFG